MKVDFFLQLNFDIIKHVNHQWNGTTFVLSSYFAHHAKDALSSGQMTRFGEVRLSVRSSVSAAILSQDEREFPSLKRHLARETGRRGENNIRRLKTQLPLKNVCSNHGITYSSGTIYLKTTSKFTATLTQQVITGE